MIKISYLTIARFVNIILISFQQTFLSAFVFFCFRSPKKTFKRHEGNILVMKTGGLGDFLFGFPAINILKKECPTASITLLTQIAFSGQHLKNLSANNLESLPWLKLTETYFDETFVIKGLSIKEILKLRKVLKEKKISSIIYMTTPGEPFLSIMKKLLFFKAISSSRLSIFGWKQNFSTAFFRKYHDVWGLSQHKINGPLKAVKHFLGYQPKISSRDFKLIELPSFKDNLKLVAFKNDFESYDGYIVICPGSSASWKNWGKFKYKELCRKLIPVLQEMNIALIMAGPQSDRPLADLISQGLHTYNICGDFSIPEFSTIFRNSHCVVTTDGGLAHLAAFSDARLVSLSNGGEEDGVVSPIGNRVTELRNAISCAPCFGMDHCPLEHSRCVKDIKVEDVFKVVQSIIQKSNYNIMEYKNL